MESSSGPEPDPPEDPPLENMTRTALLDAAATIIERRRAGGPGVAEIARVAGVSRPTVYAHFGTADAVIEAVVARLRDEFLRVQESADTTSPIATYRTTLVATLDLTVRHVGLLALLVTQARLDARMAAMWRDIHDRPVARHARFIDRLADEGAARPAAASWVIAEAIDGATTRFAQLIDEDPSRRDELTHALLDLQHRLVGLDEDGPAIEDDPRQPRPSAITASSTPR